MSCFNFFLSSQQCDLGQKSTLHAVKSNRPVKMDAPLEEEPETSEQSMVDSQLNQEHAAGRSKAQFFVHCGQCNDLCKGKLRVRCAQCKGGAFTVHRDPANWEDVLKPKQITGHCESREEACVDSTGGPPFTEFYFKCAQHQSGGEQDFAVPLSLVKVNLKDVPCLACTDVCDVILVFPCPSGHVTCLDCFKHYATSRLMERQFVAHATIGYTLPCPTGCENSFIEETHHFKLLSKQLYERYQRWATEEFVLQAGGILCPQQNCGMGLLIDNECRRIHCHACGFVFCKNCLQGNHIGDCLPEAGSDAPGNFVQYAVDPSRASESRWVDETASRVTIKISTKPCPKCRTPTERDGGCMHMVCVRSGCGFDWCWVCQTEWTRDCMSAHWFG
jgi:parkin